MEWSLAGQLSDSNYGLLGKSSSPNCKHIRLLILQRYSEALAQDRFVADSSPLSLPTGGHTVDFGYLWACGRIALVSYGIWGFPKIGVPPVIIHFHDIFLEINHPFSGTRMTMEPPISPASDAVVI